MKIGDKINHLTIVDEAIYTTRLNRKFHKWVCKCDCGNIRNYSTAQLLSGHFKTCGCKKTKFKNLIGNKYGRFTVIAKDIENSYKWICQCSCGSNPISVDEYNLISGKSQSCGCLRKEAVREKLLEDLTNQKFGRLTVIDIDNTKSSRETYWVCQCECGKQVSVRANSLKNGETRSCGCLRSEITSKRFSNDLTGHQFGKVKVLYRTGTDVGIDGAQYARWKCQCECGTIFETRGASLSGEKTQSCGCESSRGERQIRTILNNRKINYRVQYSFDDLRSNKNWKLRFDFGLLDSNNKLVCLIEFQGIQHYIEQPQGFGKQQREVTDIQKREYCKDNNITLYEIPYNANIECELDKIINAHKTISCQASS